MQTRPTVPGIGRTFASVPTLDTERNAPFSAAKNWKPDQLSIFNHNISIDIPTGNLVISTNDCGYPYYQFVLGINRKYDMQEQHMANAYYRNYTNVNPKPRYFGNWQFAYEADVDETWHNSCSEVHVTSNIGANGLFDVYEQDFRRNIKKSNEIDATLRTYGIPGRTLNELDWQFNKNDFLLRTIRGDFRILTGHYEEETLVDDIDTDMWLFSPIYGTAFNISSRYFYNVCNDVYRDVGHPLLVTKLVDALGHTIEFKPITNTVPYKECILSDAAGRTLHIELDKSLVYLDGLYPSRKVRKYLVTKVTDETKSANNELEYDYSNSNQLEVIHFPSTIGDRYIRYHYADATHPGIITSIENSFGKKIDFEYIEDPHDNDERLNPRLKIKRIIDPVGITYEYEYQHENSEVIVTILENGTIDTKKRYKYIRDEHDSKQRYITLTEYEVRRGYVTGSHGNIVSRQSVNPQIIRHQYKYTKEGRYNLHKAIDPLNRMTIHEYNDYNQVIYTWDFDAHTTENIYDIPADPSPLNPIRYDLLYVKKENLLREPDSINLSGFQDDVKDTEIEYQYDRYDSDNSNDLDDHGKQSNHRVYAFTDEKVNTWTYLYDDASNIDASVDPPIFVPRNYWPTSPTTIRSPLGIEVYKTYNNRGENTTITDVENNTYTYIYNDQGNLRQFTNPNNENVYCYYYDCGNWLHRFENQSGKTSIIDRDEEGNVIKITDPVNDSTDYSYYSNGRLKNVIGHRNAALQDTAHPENITIDYEDLITEFNYTPLGQLRKLTNPNGLDLVAEYDEAERIIRCYHDVMDYKKTKYLYDKAGQLKAIEDRKGNITSYTHHNSGLVKTVQYPNWSDGTNDIAGKLITYEVYDYHGRILTVTDSELGATHYWYDGAGNLVRRIEPNNYKLNLIYDNDNRLTNVADNSGIYKLDLILDNFGRPDLLLDSTYLGNSLTWQYIYHKTLVSGTRRVLNLYQITLPAIGIETLFDYTNSDLLKIVEHKATGATSNILFSQELQYRDDELIEKIINEDANSFRYDGIKQLIFEQDGGLSLDYDRSGNRSYRINRAASSYHNNQYDNQNKNRLEIDYGINKKLDYDDNGNLTQQNSIPATPSDKKEYYFDGNNHLRIIRNSQYTINYIYDHDGKLKKRTLENYTRGTMDEEYFQYLFLNPIIISRNGVVHMLLTWDPFGRLLRIRLQNTVGGTTEPHSLFPIYDGQNNIVRLIDSDKSYKVSVKYSPHGDIVSIIDPGNIFEYFGYKGGLYDKQAKLILFGARWYSPMIGRWISEDPSVNFSTTTISYKTLSNLYSYALNDPINKLDITGLSAENDWDIAEATVWLENNYPCLDMYQVAIFYAPWLSEGTAYGLPSYTTPVADVILVGSYATKGELIGLLAHERLHNLFGMAAAQKHSFMRHFEMAIKNHYEFEQKSEGTFDKLTLQKHMFGMPYCSSPVIPAVRWTGNNVQNSGYRSIEENIIAGAYTKTYKK